MNVFYTLIRFIFVPCALCIVLKIKDIYNTLKIIEDAKFEYSIDDQALFDMILYENDISIRYIDHMKNDWMNTRYYGDCTIMIRNAV